MESKLEIGPYSRDVKDREQAYHYIDEYGMYSVHRPGGGRGDSLGGNWDIYLIYDDWKVVKASSDLWYYDHRTEKYVGQRHPLITPQEHPMSRDHYLNTLLQLKLYEKRNGFKAPSPKIEEIVKGTGFIISKMARKTLSLACWSRALLGSKRNEFFYYLIEIFTLVFYYLPFHVLGSWLGEYGEEVDQDEWVKVQLQDQPKYKTVISKIIYPSYAIGNAGMKLYILDKFPRMRAFVKWLHRPMIGKTNYVHQMLFGMKVPRDKVEEYISMEGGRWSGYLSIRNDRNLKALNPQPVFNKVDVDLVRFLYNETQI